MKLLLVLCLVSLVSLVTLVHSQAPPSVMGANCVLIPGWSNSIFEYSQTATHVTASLRISGVGANSWLSIGFDSISGSKMSSGTVHLGGFDQNSQPVYREGILSTLSLPSDIGQFADSINIAHVGGISTLTVTRSLIAPNGSPSGYFSIPSFGDVNIIVAYRTLTTIGTNSFPKHTAATRFNITLSQTQNTCSSPLQPSGSNIGPRSSNSIPTSLLSTPMLPSRSNISPRPLGPKPSGSMPTPLKSIPMPPSGSDFGPTSCIPVPSSSNNAVFLYKNNATHILASVIVTGLGAGSWVSLGFDTVNKTAMSSGTIYLGSIDASGNITTREGLLSGFAIPADIGRFADQVQLQSGLGLTALSVLRPFAAPINAPAAYISLNTTLNSILVAYRNQSTLVNNISKHTFAKRFTVSLSQVQDLCNSKPTGTSTVKPVNSSGKVELAVALLILIFSLLF